MEKNNIGCIIVNNLKDKPIGIITERDLATRVVARNIQPNKITSKEIMSAPLVTIESKKTINDAARRMNILKIRRLGVMHKGNLSGIISSKDILAVTPELIEIIQEKARIEGENNAKENERTLSLTGYCDYCESWSEDIKEVDGKFLCEECRTIQ
jgi:signal-transduction protein with cAMP-binding, CBS, and nucleotidyltransferase domain